MTVVTKTQINDSGGELIPEGTELKVIYASSDYVKVQCTLNGIEYVAILGLKVFQLFCAEDLQ